MKFDEGNLLDYVTERPDSSLDWNKPECPFCDSRDLNKIGVTSTCLGWFPRTPADDVPECPGNPNNTLATYECNSCGKEFYYSVYRGCIYVSAVVGGNEIIMKGLPHGVSVRCKYTCNCSGSLTVEQGHKPKGKMRSSSDDPGHGYRLVCARCGLDVLLSPRATYSPKIYYKNALADIKGDDSDV